MGGGVTFTENIGVLVRGQVSMVQGGIAPYPPCPSQRKYLREKATMESQVTMVHARGINAKYTS